MAPHNIMEKYDCLFGPYPEVTTLQSLTGPVQSQYRVFPVYFSHTGKNLFSLQGSQVMTTGFSLLGKVHREIPVFITGMGLQCSSSVVLASAATTLHYDVPAICLQALAQIRTIILSHHLCTIRNMHLIC